MKRRYQLIFVLVLASISCLYSITGAVGSPPAAANNVDSAVTGPPAAAPAYYYVDGLKKDLVRSQSIVGVKFKNGVSPEQKKSLIDSQGILEPYSSNYEAAGPAVFVARSKSNAGGEKMDDLITSLKDQPEVSFVAPAFDFPEGTAVETDEIIVRFKDSLTDSQIDLINRTAGVEAIKESEWGDYVLRVSDPTENDSLSVANSFVERGLAEYAHPNFMVLTELPAIPVDQYFPLQWGLVFMRSPLAWDITKGSSSVKIAVLDSGVELNHEDLVTRLVGGYDAVDGDAYPNPAPWDYHGTAVAGAAAAGTNNTVGVAGSAWSVRVMPVRLFYRTAPDGPWITYYSWLSDGLRWAADHGAKVINNSWGVPPADSVTYAIQYARGRGSTILCAAGNDNGSIIYPANRPEVIAVGASDMYDNRASFSNYGAALDIVAPGVSIYTTDIMGKDGISAGNYNWVSGTSIATPLASGVAALIVSQDPSRSPAVVQSILQSTADDQGTPGRDDYFGYGRVNSYRALGGTLPL